MAPDVLSESAPQALADSMQIGGQLVRTCRYGENAWQTPAGLYTRAVDDPLAIDRFELVAGAEPSYNNICEVDRLLQTATHIVAGLEVNYLPKRFVALGSKHGNCCGAAINDSPVKAVERMINGDKRAIFGGLVLVNFPVGEEIAETLLRYGMKGTERRLLDGVIAPSFTARAVETLKRRGDKCRFLANPALGELTKDSLDTAQRFRYVRGGTLVQPNYTYVLDLLDPELESIGEDLTINEGLAENLVLAWAVGSTSNSNTITLVENQYLCGNAVGQQDRVSGCELAIRRAERARHALVGTVAYSDSFFPFKDGPLTLLHAGIKTILATSGSVRDEEVRELCRHEGMRLFLLPDVKARGFFGH